MRVEEAGLAESPRRNQPDGDPIGGGALQRVELGTSVDQAYWRHRTLIVERIHRT
jgi:hypothetical protein